MVRWGEMRLRRPSLALAIFVGAGILVSSASGAGGPSPSPSPIPQGCQLQSPQPEAPLILNVVALRNLVKTVAIEKEVFSCFDSSSTLGQVKEVDTFIELTARGGPGNHEWSGSKQGHDSLKHQPGFVPLTKTVNADTCTKDLKTGGVSCASVALPLGVTTTPLTKCSLTKGTYPFPSVVQPTHPLQMETATLRNGLVETVALEKEVFDCAGQIGDVYLFTEVAESAKDGGFAQLGTRFEGIVCYKDESTATVVACKLFTPSPASTG
jgi:hypothetical protein